MVKVQWHVRSLAWRMGHGHEALSKRLMKQRVADRNGSVYLPRLPYLGKGFY